jgi:hypothetical protein
VKIGKVSVLLTVIISLMSILPLGGAIQAAVSFTATELLCCPTDHSITVNVVPSSNGYIKYQYGITPGTYSFETGITTLTSGIPANVVIDGLSANTRYFYRMVSSSEGDSWTQGTEHSFYTQRTPGSTFNFTIIADSHMNGGGGTISLYEQTLNNIINDQPDFHLDLGDTFWIDTNDSTQVNNKYLAQRNWMSVISHSAPIFLAAGNHEREEGWNFDDTPVSKALLSLNARKTYYPNPIPDSFYTGNTDDSLTSIIGDHLREDYYAWTWGDALFVVIDPYEYTMINPYGTAGGEDNDETVVSHDRWTWTLGQEQYNWFKQTLENSNAKYKFVFGHHQLGGGEDYVRGGAKYAGIVEWGGYNYDSSGNPTTWGFDTQRPGWEAPIHQLMIDNHVSAFFHGHDHVYAYEKRDGIVYQSLPAPSMTGSGFSSYYTGTPYIIQVLPNSGHLRVTVAPNQATVDYIKTSDGSVYYSYTIEPSVVTPYSLSLAANPVTGGSATDLTGGSPYPTGSIVNIKAEASQGYHFVNWSAPAGTFGDTNATETTFTMPAQNVTVTAHFAETAKGLLKVQTIPPSRTRIYLDDFHMEDWGLNYVKMPVGGYMFSFSDVYNYQTPTNVTVNYRPGPTGNVQSLGDPIEIYENIVNEVIVNFVELGNLRVETSPPMPATIYCNGVPMDDWGFWTNILPGQYTITFESIDGYLTPDPQEVTVVAGQTTHVIGTYEAGQNTVTPVAHGLLRVQTDPAVPTTVYLDGIQREDWCLNWVKIPPGAYTLSFSDVYDYNTPTTVTVNYYPGTTGNVQSLSNPINIYDGVVTEVIVHFQQLGNLRVETDHANKPPTIYRDGKPMDDWAFWCNIEPGQYTISFETISGKLTPPPITVTVNTGATTHVIADYDTGQTTLQ